MTECRSVFAALIMPQEAFCVIGETATQDPIRLAHLLSALLSVVFSLSFCLYL